MNFIDEKPLVSIIINCFNSEEFLHEAIDSVLQQSYSNFELIFWDNQSTDNSAQIARSYDDPRIKYYYSLKHTSLGEARNLALEKVEGEFISFLDADDSYNINRIEECLRAFVSVDVGLVYTNGEVIRGGIRVPFYQHVQKHGEMFHYWLKRYKVMIPSVMFRRKCLESLGDDWVDIRFSMVEEYDFFLRISRLWKVNYCHEKLCMWRDHPQSMTWSKTELWGREFFLLAEKLSIGFSVSIADLALLRKKSALYYYLGGVKKGEALRGELEAFVFSDFRFMVLYFLSFFGVKINFFIFRVMGFIK
ncbi:MAG: glycosyltransferase [Oceanospirillaceae bacterium]|nr:glycosyltransferase [Oceanospirillaceae bacterium]